MDIDPLLIFRKASADVITGASVVVADVDVGVSGTDLDVSAMLENALTDSLPGATFNGT